LNSAASEDIALRVLEGDDGLYGLADYEILRWNIKEYFGNRGGRRSIHRQ
jgi:hypothetical protein